MNTTQLSPISHLSDIEGELREMGITSEIFENALRAGLLEYNKVTKLHPVTAAGSRAWEEIIAVLRSGLLGPEGGWGYSHENGLSLTHNKDLGMTIVVSSGNKSTGKYDENAKTKNAKGSSTLEYVGRNYSLFDDIDTNITDIRSVLADPHETWVLLYHIDEVTREIRFELSLPKGLHETEGKLKIDEWEKRIICTSIPFDSQIIEKEKAEFSEEINFSEITDS